MAQKGFMRALRFYENLFEAPQRCKKKVYVNFYFNYFRMLRTGRVNKVFSPEIFINISKNSNKHEKLLFKI